MPSLVDWAKIILADKSGSLGGDKSAALSELRTRAGDAGQTLAQYVEPALSVGSSVAGSTVGGLVGAAGLPYGVDAAANAVQRTQDWFQYVPKTQGGQRGMQVFGDAMSNLEQKVNTVTGIGSGALTYGLTGDPQKAVAVGADVYNKGVGTAAGDYVLDATGSPILATGVSMIPEVIDAVAGTKIAGKIPGQQFDFSGINGQKFGQAGTVSGVDEAITSAVRERPDSIILDKVIVPEAVRGQGAGTDFMNSLIGKADEAGKRIELSPSADFGGNKKRLIDFYKRFGFVENKGKNKDFEISESMYRPAKAPVVGDMAQVNKDNPHLFDFDITTIKRTEGAGQNVDSYKGDIDRPVSMTIDPEGNRILLDGHHRLKASEAEGRDSIRGLVIPYDKYLEMKDKGIHQGEMQREWIASMGRG